LRRNLDRETAYLSLVRGLEHLLLSQERAARIRFQAKVHVTFAIIRGRIVGRLILLNQKLFVIGQLAGHVRLLLARYDRIKKDELHYQIHPSLFVEQGERLVLGHWNLLVGVSSDPRVLQSSICVVSFSASIGAKLVKEIFS
jgi:hypothetical protein